MVREQVLVRWCNPEVVPDLWEDKFVLQARFPATAAWGQAASQERGDVSYPDMSGPPPDESTRPNRARQVISSFCGPKWVNTSTMTPSSIT